MEKKDYIYWLKLLLLYLEMGFIISLIGMVLGGEFLNFITAFICSLTAITSLVVSGIYKKTLEEVSFCLAYISLLLIGAATYSVLKIYVNHKFALCLFILFLVLGIVFAGVYLRLKKVNVDVINKEGIICIIFLTTIILMLFNVFILKLSNIGFGVYLAGAIIFLLYIIANLRSFKVAVNKGKIKEREDLGMYIINLYLYII